MSALLKPASCSSRKPQNKLTGRTKYFVVLNTRTVPRRLGKLRPRVGEQDKHTVPRTGIRLFAEEICLWQGRVGDEQKSKKKRDGLLPTSAGSAHVTQRSSVNCQQDTLVSRMTTKQRCNHFGGYSKRAALCKATVTHSESQVPVPNKPYGFSGR